MNTLINHHLLAEAIRQLKKGNEVPYSPVDIEWWWDEIGTWRGQSD